MDQHAMCSSQARDKGRTPHWTKLRDSCGQGCDNEEQTGEGVDWPQTVRQGMLEACSRLMTSSLTPSVPIPQIHCMQSGASLTPTLHPPKVQELWGDLSPWSENGCSHSQVRRHGEGRTHLGPGRGTVCTASQAVVLSVTRSGVHEGN